MIAMSVVLLVVAACLGSAFVARIQDTKTRDCSIASDFAAHYLELVKGLDFDEVRPGASVNKLYDGAAGSPRIAILATDAWTAIDTADYQSFHPDLVWLTNRNLQMKCALTLSSNATKLTTKHLNMELRWLPPLNVGATQSLRFDLLRARDS